MKKIKELLFIQKPPTLIEGQSQTAQIEVEELIQEEDNKSIQINFGTFLVEGWLEYSGVRFGDQNEFELKAKDGIQDELFLFLNDDEFGRFRQKEEKLLYYLISNQVIRMKTSKTKIFMKENQDLRIIILPFQIILLQDLWSEKAREIQKKETTLKRLKLLQLENILNSSFFKSYIKQFQMYTEFFQFQNSLLLQSMRYRESPGYKKQSSFNQNGGVLIDSRNNLSCFETVYEHVWKKRSFLKKSMIITYNSQLARQKILEIQNKYPKLVIVFYDPNDKEELQVKDDFHLLLITYGGVRKQHEIEKSQYGVQTIFGQKWKRIILDRTVETSEFSYPIEVDQLVGSYKWFCIQNKKIYDLETLKCICSFFDLHQHFIQKLDSNFTKSSSYKVSLEFNNFLLELNSQKLIFEKRQSIQIENSYFNLSEFEAMQYRDQQYQLQEQANDSLNLQKQFHCLRQLCYYSTIDNNEKSCQICFQPLYVYYQISSCKHIFCIKCIQQCSLCQFCQQSFSRNEIQVCYHEIPQNIVCNESRMRHLHFLIKSLPKYDRVIIFSQMSACLAEIQNFLNGNGYEVNNGVFSQEAEKTVSQFNYDRSLKILVINPFLVYSLHYEIKQAHHVIFYEPLQDYNVENALWSRLYNIKSITRIIAKSTIEESIIVSSDLWSKHKNLQGFEENIALVKEIINQ